MVNLPELETGQEQEKMESKMEKFPISRITEQGRTEVEDIVVTEFPLTIALNGQDLVTLLCSPTNLEYLAVGFLLSQGMIEGRADVKTIMVDDRECTARIETDRGVDIPLKPILASGGGKGVAFPSVRKVITEPRAELSASRVFSLVEDFVQRSSVFKTTGGVHSAALCDAKSILIFSEDIGRHNAIDRIFGECLLKDIPTDNRFIITSGRVSSEILLKVAKRNIPILISKSAPTDLGVRLAGDLGVTLIGFARAKRMNVYANSWRLTR